MKTENEKSKAKVTQEDPAMLLLLHAADMVFGDGSNSPLMKSPAAEKVQSNKYEPTGAGNN